jgi:hypothetical protein
MGIVVDEYGGFEGSSRSPISPRAFSVSIRRR